ncbi:hypothetical protein ScPMuIL_014407 [Solemya velum]
MNYKRLVIVYSIACFCSVLVTCTTPGDTTSTPSSEILLNEVYFDASGHDMAGLEFIELFGPPSSELNNMSLVLYSENATLLFALPLTNLSLDANGYFLIGAVNVTNASLSLSSSHRLLEGDMSALVLYRNPDPEFKTSNIIDGLVDFLIYGIGSHDETLITLLALGQRPILGLNDTASEDSASRCGSHSPKNQRGFHQGKRTPGLPNDCPTSNSLRVSEISLVSNGTESHCFVELYSNKPSFSLDQFVLVTIDDQNDANETILDLWSKRTNEMGYFLAGEGFKRNLSDANVLKYGCDWLSGNRTVALALLKAVEPSQHDSINITGAEVLNGVLFNTVTDSVDKSILEKLSTNESSIVPVHLGNNSANFMDGKLSINLCEETGGYVFSKPSLGMAFTGCSNSGNSTTAPITGKSTAARTTENSTAAPTTENSTAAPTTENSTAAPTTGNSTAAPTTGISTNVPTTTNSTDVPTTKNSTDIPTTKNSTDIPTTNNSTDIPTTKSSTDIPTTKNSTDIPTTGNSTDIPTTENSTDATTGNSTNAPISSTTNTPTTVPTSHGAIVINEVMIDESVMPQKIELKGKQLSPIGNCRIIINTEGYKKYYDLDGEKFDENGFFYCNLTVDEPNKTKKPSNVKTQMIALYDMGNWTETQKKNYNFIPDGLVDAVVFSTFNNIENATKYLKLMSAGSTVLRLNTSKYGHLKGSSISISRCSDGAKTSKVFAVTKSSIGISNNKFCPSRQHANPVEMYIKNADCNEFKDVRMKQSLTMEIVQLMNEKCQCGFTEVYFNDVQLHCGSVIFKAVLMAIDDKKKEDQFTSYKAVVKTSEITVKGKTYPLKSCYINCDKSEEPDDNVRVTVAVVVSCLAVFCVIVIIVIIHLKRKKRGLLNFRMKRLDDSDDELIGDMDDFVGGQDATFDSSSYSRLNR